MPNRGYAGRRDGITDIRYFVAPAKKLLLRNFVKSVRVQQLGIFQESDSDLYHAHVAAAQDCRTARGWALKRIAEARGGRTQTLRISKCLAKLGADRTTVAVPLSPISSVFRRSAAYTPRLECPPGHFEAAEKLASNFDEFVGRAPISIKEVSLREFPSRH